MTIKSIFKRPQVKWVRKCTIGVVVFLIGCLILILVIYNLLGYTYITTPQFFKQQYSSSTEASMAYICLDVASSTCCGGTQIHPRLVITAAHCVDSSLNVMVMVGASNMFNEQNLQYLITRKDIIIHEGYSGMATLENDIALIKLPKTVAAKNSAIVAIANCTDLMDAFCSYQNRSALAMGWESSDIPLVQNVTIIKCSEEDLTFCNCSAILPKVCSVDHGKPCVGWSGGPLLWNNMQFGIISGGPEVCNQSSVVDYTNILSYLPWIRGHIAKIDMEEDFYRNIETNE